jgi:hypothetical protein
MNNYYYVLFIVIFLFINIYYHKLLNNENNSEMKKHIEYVNKYLINNDNLENSKPLLWIYVENSNNVIPSKNQRRWLNFGSRNTNDLNMPFQNLTINSIINKCKNDFNIIIVDDNSFKNIIPNWNIDLNKVALPIKYHLRNLALMNILYYYGGLLVPSSFLCFKSLYELYYSSLCKANMFSFEFVNRTSSANESKFIMQPYFIGCKQESENMKKYINYLTILNSKDFVAEQDFLGTANLWLENNNIMKIDGLYIGTKDTNGKMVIVDELINNTYLDIHQDSYGLYIPWYDIVNRINFQWFARLNEKQVLESETNIGKYILLSSH